MLEDGCQRAPERESSSFSKVSSRPDKLSTCMGGWLPIMSNEEFWLLIARANHQNLGTLLS